MPPLRFLSVVRRRLRLIVAGAATGQALTLVGAFFLAVAVLDTINALPGWLRLGLWLAVLMVLAVVLWRHALRPLGRDMSLPIIAGLIERRRPIFNGRLFGVVEGLPLSPDEQAALDACCAACPPAALVHAQALRRTLALVMALSLTIAAAGLLWPQWMGTAVGRVFMPWSQAYQHPRRCQIEAELVETVVADDQSLMVEVRSLRGGPDLLQITWQDATGRSGTHRAGSLTGPWRERLDLDPGDYRLTVRYGDSLPVTLAARVVRRPHLTDISVSLSPPAYTGFADETLGAPTSVMALPGSTIAVRFSAAPHPDDGEQSIQVRYGDQTMAVQEEPSANTWRCTLPIADGGDLRLDLVDHHISPDGKSVAISAEPPLRLPISLMEDARPRISLDGPRRNETVGINAQIDLRMEARDDIGLAALRLMRQFRDDQERPQDILHERPMPRLEGRLVTEVTERYRLTIGSLAAVGDEIVLIAEAEDANDITGPGIGHSDPLALRVVNQDSLRQELDRLLGDARDRLALARDQLAVGLGDEEQTATAARSARSVARRADEYLQQAARRWRQNQLDAAQMQTIDRVTQLVQDDVLEALGAAADGRSDAPDQALTADRALAEAERQLSGMLQVGDLADTLARLIDRQRRLGEDSAEFVLHYARTELDGAGRNRQAHLGERQQDLGRQLNDWQHRLLATTEDFYTPVRELAQQRHPADLLHQAARIIVRDSERRLALERQQDGLAVMEELLRLLRGSEDLQALADIAANLARRQQELRERLEEGTPPGRLRPPQDTLREDTEALGERLHDTDDDEIQDALQQALAAQRRAAEAMASGNRPGSEQETARAAEELQRLHEALGGNDQDASHADDNDDDSEDALTILAGLRQRQQNVVRQAETLRRDQDPDADQALGFATRRRVRALVDEEENIHLILREDILAALAEAPLAQRAFTRLDRALERAIAHLEQPALGERGVRLVTIVLFEMDRLLDIIASLPPPQEEEDDGTDGGDQGAEQREVFPARAQLALLLAEQRELRALTATGVPVDQAGTQAELRDLMEALHNSIRSGSRPQVLMQRAFRAAASAAWELAEDGRRDHVLNEQDAAISALQRILEEATAQRSPSQEPEQAQARPPDEEMAQAGRPRDDMDEDEAQAEPGDDSDSPSDPEDGSRQAMSGDADGVRVRTGETGEGWLMRLPPQMRRPLDEARRRNLPPEGILLYRRFLELLLEDE